MTNRSIKDRELSEKSSRRAAFMLALVCFPFLLPDRSDFFCLRAAKRLLDNRSSRILYEYITSKRLNSPQLATGKQLTNPLP
jgi:hypothetical protein